MKYTVMVESKREGNEMTTASARMEERRQAQQAATRDRSREQTTAQRIKSAVEHTPDQEAQVNQCRHHLRAGHTEDFLIGMGYAQAAIDKAAYDMSKIGRE